MKSHLLSLLKCVAVLLFVQSGEGWAEVRIVNSNAVVPSAKRGVAVATPGNDRNSLSPTDFRALANGISWYYNWGILPLNQPADLSISYVPMVYGAGSGYLATLQSYLSAGHLPWRVLALNEPNFIWESNLTPQAAASAIAQLRVICDLYGIPVVGPQMTIGTDPSMSVTAYDPIQNATVTYTYQENYLAAFDYYCGSSLPYGQATHSYGGSGEVSWITGVMSAARPTQPVWITEMNLGGASDYTNAVSNLMTTVDYLERTTSVEGYGWFMARISGDPYNSLLSADGVLTPTGQAYVQMPVHDANLYYQIPGRLQAERYVTTFGNGIAPTTDSEGFADMVCGVGGARLDYNLSILTAGSYAVSIRVTGSGSIQIYQGSTLLGTATASSSGWSTVSTTVSLSTGSQTLRVVPSVGQRLNWIDWVSSTPATPSNVTAVPGSGKARLTWSRASNATTYKIHRAAVSGGSYTEIARTDVETFLDTALTNGQNYYYVVSALNNLGSSANSAQVTVQPSTNAVLNNGFESPATTSYTFNPTGSFWTFSGSSGVTANASGYTTGNPSAPSGSQVAFLQANSTISQALTSLTPGSLYTITFSAAQRQNWGGAQTWNVMIDGKTIASYSPARTSTTYSAYTASFSATSFSHTLAFVGTTTSDNTALIDDVRVESSSNLGFETPATDSSIANPTSTAWTFSGSSGVAANFSGFTWMNPIAPEGKQVAYLQANGSMTQTISGLTAGENYTIAFSAAQRSGWGGAQTWNVAVNGTVIASFDPAQYATAYTEYIAQFTATSTSQTVSFIGTTSGDNTVFIDNVRITKR